MGEALEITVNGKRFPYEAGMTLASLIAGLSPAQGSVVAEVNGNIIPREAFEGTLLDVGDRIEIVHFVGGG
ncbi:MAG: sulfur carrier protein ThiS [Deltaproteobacteria bacterium]|nr:sulfur carrier protein ThiS [Deltaproteobacteria bacterium]